MSSASSFTSREALASRLADPPFADSPFGCVVPVSGAVAAAAVSEGSALRRLLDRLRDVLRLLAAGERERERSL